MPFVFITVC